MTHHAYRAGFSRLIDHLDGRVLARYGGTGPLKGEIASIAWAHLAGRFERFYG